MLKDIAYNVWWTWNSKAIQMFSVLSPDDWSETNHNPVKLLNIIDENNLIAASESEDFLRLYSSVVEDYTAYMSDSRTWVNDAHEDIKDKTIVYLCAEYGITESIPIYSGGLGVLAGDHLKSASDLGLPFVAIGLFYQKGYFIQQVLKNGSQNNEYITNRIEDLPMEETRTADGQELIISVLIEDYEVYAKVWEMKVGINKLYLLDTNIDKNTAENRNITYSLYGGDQNQRIKQEIVLGIGGVKVVKELELDPYAWHINEGHSAFFVYERIKKYMENDTIDFYEALEIAKSNAIFTTHTPVAAGNDMFPVDLIERHLRQYFSEFKTNKQYLISLGEHLADNSEKMFSMTVLALKTTTFANGVSKLHGSVSRELWKKVWNNIPVNEVPIDYITNGIHTSTWLDGNIKELLSDNFEMQYRNNAESQAVWNKVYDIPEKNLWDLHQYKKEKLFAMIKERVNIQRMREYGNQASDYEFKLDKDVLTIGFARRFATYKRANLIFKDIDRLKSIISNYKRPVQIIFAGKAHPADAPGQAIIKSIYELSIQSDFRGKIIFVENYDMNLARAMIQGVDIWLNNPRRPYEASGTSGEKAGANGVINFSVLDGWWCEGYNKKNGWAIGDYRKYTNNEQQDDEESKDLYNILEKEIIPMYYDKKDEGYSYEWVQKMKNSIATIASEFNMHRQVKEYYEKFYKRCIENKTAFDDKKVDLAKQIKHWKERLYQNWDNVEIKGTICSDSKISFGEALKIKADVNLENLTEQDVVVEAYIGVLDENDNIVEYKTVEMGKNKEKEGKYYEYEANITLDTVGKFAYTTRIIPNNIYLGKSREVGLIKWAE